jgi:hypothetical protein
MQALDKFIRDGPVPQRMGPAAPKHVDGLGWDVLGRQWQIAYLEIAVSRMP